MKTINYNQNVYFNQEERESISNAILKDLLDNSTTKSVKKLNLNVNITNNLYNFNERDSNNTRKSNRLDKIRISQLKQLSKQNNKNNDELIGIYSIPCINCQNLINLNEIDQHSQICLNVRDDLIFSQNNPNEENDLKIQKLIDYIAKNSQNANFLKNPEAHYYEVLSRYLMDALNENNENSFENIKKIRLNIESLSCSFKGSINVLILIERANTLIKTKFNFVKESEKGKSKKTLSNCLSLENLHNIKQEKEKEIKQLETEKEMWKRKAKNFKKYSNNFDSFNNDLRSRKSVISQKSNLTFVENKENMRPSSINNRLILLSEIDSDYARNVNESPRTSLESSPRTSALSSKIEKMNQDNDALFVKVENDGKKKNLNNFSNFKEFVKIFLKIKFEKMHNLHKGHSISDKELWKECVRRGVQASEWEQFILEEMKSPEKYKSYKKKHDKLT